MTRIGRGIKGNLTGRSNSECQRLVRYFPFAPVAQFSHSLLNLMIKRIKIRDFKSIRELDLEFDPVTVLVGRSGTGKSNLVQAIRFLRNLLLNYNEAISYEFGWDRIAPVGEKSPKTSIEVSFAVPGDDKEYSYRIVFAAQ